MKIDFNPDSVSDYKMFLNIKRLPQYRIIGRTAVIPDEYAHLIGGAPRSRVAASYEPAPFLFDYQKGIAELAIRKKKFAVFADCGLGKTLILLEFARHCLRVLPTSKRVLIVCPLMVASQTIAEAFAFYGSEIPIEHVPSARINDWLKGAGGRIGITNYEAMNNVNTQGSLGALILDESSMLKSHYGKWGTACVELGRGLEWKLALTGTPAPNDRIEYGNHAVFVDRFKTINEFLARYFVNKGQTNERWELRPHALKPFYRELSHWCVFLTNPATYGWKDNCESIPPINVHIDHIEMTDGQRKAMQSVTGKLVASAAGGIGQRSKLAKIGKGFHNGGAVDANKPAWIVDCVNQYEHPSIIWCRYNDEQDGLARMLPDAANIDGSTPYDRRVELIQEYKEGRRPVLISKPKILGFGLNLQIARQQVFSSLQDSYEEYYQAVKRSNRYGSEWPLTVRIPVTETELPMVETVLAKADRIQQDTAEQELLFKECGIVV